MKTIKANRVHKTEENLKTVWKQLDNACVDLDNALDTLNRMVDLPSDFKSDLEVIDFTLIVALKNRVEELLEDKEEGSN